MRENWIHNTITVNKEIELFYTRTGGDKPQIVLLHGSTDNGLCWEQFAQDIEEKYDVIMYDAYGHGKSSRIDPKKRFDMAEDLHDLIIGLELEKPGIIGHSTGAEAAAEFAVKYPDHLSLLVLEDPPWRDQTFEEAQTKTTMAQWKKRNESEKQKTVKELVKLKKKESPNWEEVILKEWAQAKLDLDPKVFDVRPGNRQNWRELAKSITVPTLIVTGDNVLGAIVTPKIGIEAIQIIDKAEFGHISSAGHCVRYEQYQPYLTMVNLFLKRNMPA